MGGGGIVLLCCLLLFTKPVRATYNHAVPKGASSSDYTHFKTGESYNSIAVPDGVTDGLLTVSMYANVATSSNPLYVQSITGCDYELIGFTGSTSGIAPAVWLYKVYPTGSTITVTLGGTGGHASYYQYLGLAY